MNRIWPKADAHAHPLNVFVPPSRCPYVGILYLFTTLACSSVYLIILQPSVTNDFWWSGFNTTGLQTYLGDVFNQQLVYGRVGELNLLNHSVYTTKSYASEKTVIEWGATYGRQLLLGNVSFTSVISNMRLLKFDESVLMMSPYCWLDLDRKFGMALTYKRQARCDDHYRSNAAFYLETLMRNTQNNPLANSRYNSAFGATIVAELRTSNEGKMWIEMMQGHKMPPVVDEIEFWKLRGLKTWFTSWQNLYHDGIEDFIYVENALGIRQAICIKKYVMKGRGLGLWTSLLAYPGLWNLLSVCDIIGCSLLLNSSKSLTNMGYSWDLDMSGYPSAPGANLIREHLGPFFSIDIRWISKPDVLIKFHQDFQDKLYAVLLGQRGAMSIDLDPVPVSWSMPGALYYGGSPLCPYGDPQAFVQETVGYYDGCTSHKPLTIRATASSVLFAEKMMIDLSPQMIESICNLCQSTVFECKHFVHALIPSSGQNEQDTEKNSILKSVEDIRVSLFQMVQLNSTKFVLYQSLVTNSRDDLWSFYGWLMIYDWLQGHREVLYFEGDEGNITMMSQYYEPLKVAANPLELPQHACNYIWYSSVYVTFALIWIGLVLLLYTYFAPNSQHSFSLFQFNRVVGSVWIGRPIMFLRGMTAVIILSTSPVAFGDSGRLSTLDFRPRRVLPSIVIAGEAVWVVYVLHDVILPLTRNHTVSCHYSSLLVWFLLFILDQYWPLELSATINPVCSTIRVSQRVQCSNGVVQIGNYSRLCWICAAIIIVSCLGLCCERLMSRKNNRKVAENSLFINELAPAAADSYLLNGHSSSPDFVVLAMAGILTIRNQVFDIELWRFCSISNCHQNDMIQQFADTSDTLVFSSQKSRLRFFLTAFGGLSYMIATVVGSYSYLVLTESTMSNDFWWASFSPSDYQSFLTNFFNTQLFLTKNLLDIHIDEPQYSDATMDYSLNLTTVPVFRLYSSHLQDEVNTLPAVVESLRNMDACMVPWISTSYCYVDFLRRWEMAPTSKLQKKCLEMEITNGAVYLESSMRNVNSRDLDSCWGRSLQVAFYQDLLSSHEGSSWLNSVRNNKMSIDEEVLTWTWHGITRFTIMWQNYKQIRLTEQFTIKNAFGLAYPLTLKRADFAFQLSLPTSFRMNWPLACLLWSVTSNKTSISGMSLLRSSQAFAFTNISIEDLLIQNATIPSPLDQALSLTRGTLGPFGLVKMRRIEVPLNLRLLYRKLAETYQSLVSSNFTAYKRFFDLQRVNVYCVTPSDWSNMGHLGGNFMCSLGADISPQIGLSYMADGTCTSNGIDEIMLQDSKSYMALIAARSWLYNQSFIQSVCRQETCSPEICLTFLAEGPKILADSLGLSTLESLAKQSWDVREDIQESFSPQILQFVSHYDNTPVKLARLNLFNRPTFDFFSWLYAFEWIHGNRELIQFIGEEGNMTILSGATLMANLVVNPQEIPLNVAFYMRCSVLYLTLVLMCVAGLVCLNILFTRGYSEGMNMLSFNRIAGLVWIGRPFMMLRGITAICILSTSSLVLFRPYPTYPLFRMLSQSPDFITTVLSSGEMGWVVYVLNDVFSLWTKEYTSIYGRKSSVSVWVGAAIWSFASPVRTVVHINRQCKVIGVDEELNCQSATLEIGSSNRFFSLIGLSIGSCVLWYCLARAHRYRCPPKARRNYLRLHAVAHYHFHREKWEAGGIFHLDQASAVLNGLLMVKSYKNQHIAFDIKTWRVFTFERRNADEPRSYEHCIPLVAHD